MSKWPPMPRHDWPHATEVLSVQRDPASHKLVINLRIMSGNYIHLFLTDEMVDEILVGLADPGELPPPTDFMEG